MPKKHKKKKSVQTDGNIKRIIIKVLRASAVGAAIFFMLCALAALIAYKKDTDPSYYKIFLLVISGISGFICGIAAILPVKRNGLIIGMASVIPAFFIIFTVITIINKTAISGTGWTSLGIMTFCGGLGGIAGNKK